MKIIAAATAVLLLAGCGLIGEDDPPARPVEMVVYLDHGVTDEEIDEIQEHLEALPAVASVRFRSQEESYAEFVERSKDGPDLLGGATVDMMPRSFRVRARGPQEYDELRAGPTEAALEAMPGVDEVLFQCVTVEECASRTPPAVD